jgi:hypothetical protein
VKIYYKATRLNGTDFYTGTVDYVKALETGKPVSRKPQAAYGFACCSDTVYHAADVAAETLIGCKWPCRLFEVTGRPVAQAGHKFGFRSLRVLREVPAHLALGPNGEQVASLIDQASRITYDQAVRLGAAWDATRGAARGATRGAARGATRGAARGAARDATWDAAWGATRGAAWDAAWGAARGATWDAAWDAAWGATRGAGWGAAWDATWDAARGAAWGAGCAAVALTVRDLVSDDVFDTLYGPWASVMLPAAEAS